MLLGRFRPHSSASRNQTIYGKNPLILLMRFHGLEESPVLQGSPFQIVCSPSTPPRTLARYPASHNQPTTTPQTMLDEATGKSHQLSDNRPSCALPDTLRRES